MYLSVNDLSSPSPKQTYRTNIILTTHLLKTINVNNLQVSNFHPKHNTILEICCSKRVTDGSTIKKQRLANSPFIRRKDTFRLGI